MMKAPIIGGVALVLALALWWVARESQPGIESKPQPASSPLTADRAPTEHVENEPAEADKAVEQLEGLNPDRLFQKDYELDPYIQAVAREAGTTAACIIAAAKLHFHQVPMEDRVCTVPESAVTGESFGVAGDHPYTKYNDAELVSLAVSDPAAAVILARRAESDEDARHFYERAVALSGFAEPLIEWMTVRNTGGLHYRNGVLDIELAKNGYEIYMTAAAFDGSDDSIIELYKKELRDKGVDLRSIEREAADRAAYLKQQRQELTGGERP